LPDVPVPWVLRALGRDRPAFLRANGPLMEVLDGLVCGPLPELLDRLAATRQVAAAVHGDLQLDNVLIDVRGSITFVDWEYAGCGDPAWDVGTLAQELISRSPATDAASCAPVLGGAVRVLQSAYSAASPETGEQPEFAWRVLGCLAARLLQRALQLASRGDAKLAAEQNRHLVLAAAVAGHVRAAPVLATTGRSAA
jgi:Ser/Thr protein kinase RdoA (MazF antagonist)